MWGMVVDEWLREFLRGGPTCEGVEGDSPNWGCSG